MTKHISLFVIITGLYASILTAAGAPQATATGDVHIDRCGGRVWGIILNSDDQSSRSDLLTGLNLVLSNRFLKVYDGFAIPGSSSQFLFIAYVYPKGEGQLGGPDEKVAFRDAVAVLLRLKQLPGFGIECRCFIPGRCASVPGGFSVGTRR